MVGGGPDRAPVRGGARGGTGGTRPFAVSRPSGLTLNAGALMAVERGDRRLRMLLDETERVGWPLSESAG